MAYNTRGAYSTGGQRSIIVLGKTGCGKSSLSNKIICQERVFEVANSFQGVTSEIKSVRENVSIEGKVYTINMIDTVGFRDPRSKGAKSDNEIIKDIKKQLKQRAPDGLNLIIFVLKNGRFTEEEHKVFKKILDNFTDMIKDLSLLVITGCDGKSKRAREDIIRNFRSDPLTKKFGDIMRKGIYCVGLPDIDDLSEGMRKVAIEDMVDDMIPIHKAVAAAKEIHLQQEIQKDKCIIL